MSARPEIELAATRTIGLALLRRLRERVRHDGEPSTHSWPYDEVLREDHQLIKDAETILGVE